MKTGALAPSRKLRSRQGYAFQRLVPGNPRSAHNEGFTGFGAARLWFPSGKDIALDHRDDKELGVDITWKELISLPRGGSCLQSLFGTCQKKRIVRSDDARSSTAVALRAKSG